MQMCKKKKKKKKMGQKKARNYEIFKKKKTNKFIRTEVVKEKV